MNFSLKRLLTPSRSKLKKNTLAPLSGLSPSAVKNNPLDRGNEEEEEKYDQNQQNNKKRKKGQFAMGNLQIKEFTDKDILDTFNAFDLDGNGFICAAEIKQCFKKLGEKITDQEIDEMIKMCDQDGDGQIEYEEFEEMVYKEAGINRKSKRTVSEVNAKAANDQQMLENQRNRTQRLRELFQVLGFETKSMKEIHQNFLLMDDAEVRSIGLIAFADFCAWYAYTPLYKQCTKSVYISTKMKVSAESKELFGIFQNSFSGDQYIDYRFFLISLVSMLAPSLEMKIQFTFDIFDIDGNGLIDRDELTAVVSASQLLKGKQLKERVDKIMMLADSDGNNELDYDEFAVCCRRYQTLLFPHS